MHTPSSDNGVNWSLSETGIPSGYVINDLTKADNCDVYGAGWNGTETVTPKLMKSTNSGSSWSEVSTTGLGLLTPYAIVFTNDKLIMSGYNNGIYNVYVCQIAETSISLVLNSFELNQNYPNPFNPITTIQFAVPEPQHVKLQIFNLTGRLVETLVDGFKEAGNWDVKWNAGNYSSGIYIYRLQYGDKHISRKMLLMK